ncbi:MAG: hypothetical protein JXA14_24095 [Anaerolineae bacterium]|nr:hypothetical protein [Anaerolineae bacterium]
MFKKLGFGLGADDKYQRAFEKGVLLGNLEAAPALFEEAAREYEKRGQVEGQRRALANAALYRYIKSGDTTLLPALIDHLGHISEIEYIGSATDTIPAAQLNAELVARRAELEIEALGAGAGHLALAAAHERARDCFEEIKPANLVVYPHVVKDDVGQDAESRGFYHAGKACWHRAQLQVQTDPAAAADEMSRAVMYYRRAGYTMGEQAADGALEHLRMQRTCWICHREMQGRGINFDWLPTAVSSYHAGLLERANQDQGSLDIAGSSVVVCVVCQTLIARQAENIAARVVSNQVGPLVKEIKKLRDEVSKLKQS